MYTGIIRATYPVVRIKDADGLRRLHIETEPDFMKGLQKGDSISIAGVCLSVADMNDSVVSFDAMKETLEKTTIGMLNEQDMVNVERSARYGDEIGGHAMAGHVYGMATVLKREDTTNNVVMTFQVPVAWMKYILEKGFIGINGCSLTVTNAQKKYGTFDVHFIPETLAVTTFGDMKEGDKVNIEIDHATQTIVDTTERIVTQTYGSQ